MVYGFLSAAAGLTVSGLAGLLVPRRMLRAEVPVMALAGLFAVAGVLAEPAAIGVDILDAMLRAALCAISVVVMAKGGSRSRSRRVMSRWTVVAAALLALMAVSPGSAWMAGAGFGLALGVAWARLNAPVLRALSAGLTAQAALRLDRPSFALGTALVAMVVFTLLLGGGLVGLRRRPRRRSIQVALATAAAAGMMSALGVWAVYQARPDVANGVGSVTSAVAQARVGNVAGATERFDEGALSFAAASGRLSSWWARPAMVVPVVSRHSRALLAMAESGSALSATGAHAAREADVSRIQLSGGTVPLDRITSLQGPAREALASLTAADERLSEVDSPWLISPVSRRRDVLSARVSQARRDLDVVTAASEIAPKLLGADGPRRYFLALQTPVEARGTGGFIGNFGEITADRGRLRLERLGRIAELNTGGNPGGRRVVAPADYLARYSRFEIDKTWQNINMSPDLPSAAQAIASLYPQSGGRPVDGVIAVDPIGLAALLRAVGPVRVRDWPAPITADNAVQVLLFDQYLRFPLAERQDFLGQVTDAVWQRLTTSSPRMVQLAQALSPVIAQKHVQVTSSNLGEVDALRRLGMAGAIAPVQGDFLGLVTQNAGGNKIDWFLRRSVDYGARFDPASGEVLASLRITLTNHSPTDGLPHYVIGSSTTPPLPRGTNKLYMSVYSPLGLRGGRLDGRAATFESERERDRNVYSAYVTIPAGATSTVELDLEGWIEPQRGESGTGYRLDLHRQPFLAPDTLTTSITLARGWKAENGHTGEDSTTRVELVADRRLQVDVSRSG